MLQGEKAGWQKHENGQPWSQTNLLGGRQSAVPTWCQAGQPGGAQPSLVAPEGCLVVHHCHCQVGLPRVLAQRRCQGELAGLQVGHSLKQPLQGQAS